mmetsp:Transcript_39859/g.63921  ORF Transcript_39859/g.63921 Transcript_39859/m.63921 type:complete len:342 (+) Transcript_39859:27-1052(+)
MARVPPLCLAMSGLIALSIARVTRSSKATRGQIGGLIRNRAHLRTGRVDMPWAATGLFKRCSNQLRYSSPRSRLRGFSGGGKDRTMVFRNSSGSKMARSNSSSSSGSKEKLSNDKEERSPSNERDIKLGIVVAIADESNAIGRDGGLIWNIPEDMAHFRNITTNVPNTPPGQEHQMNAVIMGRITWESIPVKFRPLKNRINVVVSRSLQNRNTETAAYGQREEKKEGLERNVLFADSLEGAIALLKSDLAQEVGRFSGIAYVIGGAALYEEAMQHKLCDTLHITRVFMPLSQGDFDRVFPVIDDKEDSLYVRDTATEIIQSKIEATPFRFETYTRRRSEQL